jgi:ubiquinone/menaquinone biosynthesis C-methylase UbiE
LIRAGKIRESGMPPEEVWNRFFNVNSILQVMGIDSNVMDALDFACGYGTFTIPAALRICGTMFAIDIDPQMVRIVEEKSTKLGVVNVRPIIRDLLLDGSGLKDGSVDYVMLFNILHSEDPLIMLHECFRILGQRGRVGIIHWRRDPSTPRGPHLEMRPTAQQCLEWCLQAGFTAGSEMYLDLKPYHFGLSISK